MNEHNCVAGWWAPVLSGHGDSTLQPAMEQSPEPYPKCFWYTATEWDFGGCHTSVRGDQRASAQSRPLCLQVSDTITVYSIGHSMLSQILLDGHPPLNTSYSNYAIIFYTICA
jgi:hypothetical protein